MSTIRERQADQTHMLLGRTRAERLLDGIYQRQKRYLLQRRRRAAAEGALRIVLPEEKRRRLLDVLPEPAVIGGDAAATHVTADQQHKVKQQARGAPVGTAAKEKNVEDAVEALQRHLWRHAKFDKAVQLLQQLWQSHFVPETKRCLLAGLLTAASTDNCVSSPSGRSEIAALFRNVVEPVLHRECERRKEAELKEQQERIERTTLRAIQFNDRLQCVVINERRAARAISAGQSPGTGVAVSGRDGAAGRHVLSSGGADAGTRATVAAVAAAAAAAVDRAQQKQLDQSCGRRGLPPGKEQEGNARRAGVSPRSADTSSITTAGCRAIPVSSSRTSTESTGSQANSLPPQAGTAAAGSGGEPEDVELNDAEKELLEVLRLRCKTHLLLFTDDAFQFNQQVAELRRVFDAMVQGIGEEEEEEELPDEEACRSENGSREATEGTRDGVDDCRQAKHQNEKHRIEWSSPGAPADAAAASPKTAGASVDFSSAVDTMQQQKVEKEDGISEPELSTSFGSQSSTVEDTEHQEMKERIHAASGEHNEAAAAPEETGGPPSGAGLQPAFTTAEKQGNVRTHGEDTGNGDVMGRETGKNGAISLACKVKVENVDGIQQTADAVLSQQETGSSTGPSADDAEDDEEVATPEERWPLPLKKGELRNLLRCFYMDCLASLFSYRNMTWARAAIEQLFQHVYLNRFVFNESDRGQIGLWQAQLKSSAKISAMLGMSVTNVFSATGKDSCNVSYTTISAGGLVFIADISALRIGEAPVPVQDGRDERITTAHGSMVWSAKQMGS